LFSLEMHSYQYVAKFIDFRLHGAGFAESAMMDDSMPSPLGHSLAGLTVGWLAETDPVSTGNRLRDVLSPLAVSCALMAALPDADLLVSDWHRTATHSVTATAAVFIVAMVVTAKVTRKPLWRVCLALAAAHATHLLLDWLAMDPHPPSGIQLFWPFSDRFYVSGLDLFPGTERRLLKPGALMVNAYSAMWELLIMGPITIAAWFVRRVRLRGRQVEQGRNAGDEGAQAGRARRSREQGARK
jgi:membrane-bound metal-dependent hydrolase YbcI (DUF457 family)